MAENTRFVNYKTNKLLEELIAAIKALQVGTGGTTPTPAYTPPEVPYTAEEAYQQPEIKVYKGETQVI